MSGHPPEVGAPMPWKDFEIISWQWARFLWLLSSCLPQMRWHCAHPSQSSTIPEDRRTFPIKMQLPFLVHPLSILSVDSGMWKAVMHSTLKAITFQEHSVYGLKCSTEGMVETCTIIFSKGTFKMIRRWIIFHILLHVLDNAGIFRHHQWNTVRLSEKVIESW